MATQKMARMIESMLMSSREGRLVWKETPDSGVFATSIPQYSVLISPYVDEDGEEEYKLQILNSFGEVIEEIIPNHYAEMLNGSFAIFKEIYELARANAMGVDAAVDAILSFLEKPRPY